MYLQEILRAFFVSFPYGNLYGFCLDKKTKWTFFLFVLKVEFLIGQKRVLNHHVTVKIIETFETDQNSVFY